MAICVSFANAKSVIEKKNKKRMTTCKYSRKKEKRTTKKLAFHNSPTKYRITNPKQKSENKKWKFQKATGYVIMTTHKSN